MSEPQEKTPEREQPALDAHPDGTKSERFETIDYVRELFLNSEEQKKSERKRLRLQTVCVSLLAVLTLAVVVSCAVLVPAGLRAVQKVTAVAETLDQIDLEGLVATVDDFSKQAGDTFVSVSDAVAVLDELDIDALNGATIYRSQGRRGEILSARRDDPQHGHSKSKRHG